MVGLVIGSSLSFVGQAEVGASDATSGAYTLTCDYGSFTLSGQATALKKDSKLTCDYGSFALTGQAVGLSHGYKLTLDYGAFALSGQAVALKKDSKLTASHGVFTLSGQTVGLKAGRQLALNYGSFTLTGQPVALKADRRLAISNGSFVLSGQDVTLTYAPASFHGTMTMETGMFALTGQDVTFTYTPAETGSIDTHDGWKKRKKAQKLLDEARRRREQEKLQDIQDLRRQLEAAFDPEAYEEPDLTPEQAEQKFQQVAPGIFDFKDDGFAKLAAAELQLIQRLISKLEAERQDEEDFAELVAMGVI